MADFEDSNSPTWENCVEGQLNLRDAIRGTISLENKNGKVYQLNGDPAVLTVRPRGWHLEEKHILVNGKPISASFFDFGLYFFHNAKVLIEKGSGPYFYLPKIENHLEARLWNDVFVYAQNDQRIKQGRLKRLSYLKRFWLPLKWMKFFMS
jgi:malate synthase